MAIIDDDRFRDAIKDSPFGVNRQHVDGIGENHRQDPDRHPAQKCIAGG
jgi:hypothetical protein